MEWLAILPLARLLPSTAIENLRTTGAGPVSKTVAMPERSGGGERLNLKALDFLTLAAKIVGNETELCKLRFHFSPTMATSEATDADALKKVRERIAAQVGEDFDLWVGMQVRDLRKARRMSLKQLGEASGLSIGLLSQIERGTSSPSIRSLHALSTALGVAPIWFFNDGKLPPQHERTTVVRRGAGRRLNLPTKRLVKELITPDLSGTLQMLIVSIEPGGSTGSDSYWHDGEECGYVLEGTLDLWVGDDYFRLEKGDSFRFLSERPHQSYNPGKTRTRVIWVTTPPFY